MEDEGRGVGVKEAKMEGKGKEKTERRVIKDNMKREWVGKETR